MNSEDELDFEEWEEDEPEPSKAIVPTQALAVVKEDDPRFLKKNGERKSNESVREIRLADKIAESFRHPHFTEQEPVLVFPSGQTYWQRLQFDLPMPPSLNNWVRTYRGKAHTSKAAITYKQEVRRLFAPWPLKPTYSMLNAELLLFGLPERSDTDNRSKQIFDALEGLVTHNDYQIRKQSAEDMDTDKYGTFVRVILTRRGVDEGVDRAELEMGYL